jgi:hypothetical protein
MSSELPIVPADISVITDCERSLPPRFPHVLTHPRQPKETAMPISPNQGSTGGGTVVTITGTNLSGASAVHFGTKLGTITAAHSVTVTSPSGAGTVPVTVTTRRHQQPAVVLLRRRAV